MKKRYYTIISLLTSGVFASHAFSALEEEAPNSILATQGAEGALTLINQLSRWLFAILTALAVVFLILAAYDFLFSGGDETKIKDARKKLIYALVAFVVGLFAWTAVLVIANFFDAAV